MIVKISFRDRHVIKSLTNLSLDYRIVAPRQINFKSSETLHLSISTMINTQQQIFEIAQWNARGFRNHVQEFYDFMSEQHIQLACISETNFNIDDIAPSHPNSRIHRFYRTNA